MEIQLVMAVLLSFAVSVGLGPIIIPFLRRLKIGQTERTQGVSSHLKKAGTPTMGGLIFLLSTTVTAVFYVKDYPRIVPVLFLTLGFGLIGFLDDYLKVVLKRSDGLYPRQKMFLQIMITAVFAVYMIRFSGIPLAMKIPFLPGKELSIGWLSVPLLFFCGAGDRQRRKFYRWTGWARFQCDGDGGCLFHGGGCRKRDWDHADHLRRRWKPAGISGVQRFPGKGIYGGHGFPGAWGLCCGNCLYAADAVVFAHRRFYLCGGDRFCGHAGDLFQGNPWQAYF